MLLGLVYLVALSHHTPFNFEFVFHLVLLSLTIVGLGGVGYTINDLFDRSQDQIVGKPNIFLNASRLNRFAVIFISILLAIGPWLWLPCNTILIGLLVIELGLFIIYSIPPIRLKEKMWLGVFVDGLYALVIPAIVVISVTELALNDTGYESFSVNLWKASLVGWLLVSGIRKIVSHQQLDYSKDVVSNTKTLAVKLGLGNTALIKYRYLIPAEIGFLIAFVLLLWFISPLLTSLSILTLGVVAITPLGEGLIKNQSDKSAILDNQLNFFLEGALPILILISLCQIDYRYIFLLFIHLLLFQPAISNVSDFGKDQIVKPIYYRLIPFIYYQGAHIFYHNGLLRFRYRVLRPLYFTFLKKPVVWAFHNLFMRLASWFWHLVYFVIHWQWHKSKKNGED